MLWGRRERNRDGYEFRKTGGLRLKEFSSGDHYCLGKWGAQSLVQREGAKDGVEGLRRVRKVTYLVGLWLELNEIIYLKVICKCNLSFRRDNLLSGRKP